MIITQKPLPSVVRLILNRPDKRNALSLALMEALLEALKKIPSDTRIVTLEGAGSFFCAGLDLEEAHDSSSHLTSSERMKELLYTLATLPCVTIASVHGGAFAGGLGLMGSCDIVLASREALFGLPELRRGLIPVLVYQILRAQVAPRFLHELILTGESITAVRAHTIGLVNQVIAYEEREEMVAVYIQQLLKSAPLATKTYKKHLYHSSNLAEAFDQALALHRSVRSSPEAQEGISAFLEKRSPNWL